MMDREKVETEIYSTRTKISAFFKENLLVIVLIISAIAFAFKEVLQFGKNDDFDWFKAISSGIITYLFAVYIYLMLGKLGRKQGKNNSLFKNTMLDLSQTKKSIGEYVDKLPVYVAFKNSQALKEVRLNILSEVAMTYTKFENGYYKEHYNDLSSIEKNAYNLASSIVIKTITARELLGESPIKEKIALTKKARYATKYNPLTMGRSESQYVSSGLIGKLASKAAYPVVFGYLTLSSLMWDNLLYGIIQTVLVILGGTINYIRNEDFTLGELRNRFVSKADYLKEFRVMYENHHPIFKEEIITELNTKKAPSQDD